MQGLWGPLIVVDLQKGNIRDPHKISYKMVSFCSTLSGFRPVQRARNTYQPQFCSSAEFSTKPKLFAPDQLTQAKWIFYGDFFHKWG